MRRVGIFWDYENCPLPSRLSGYTVAGNIRKAAGTQGDEISVFKAYADMHQETKAIRQVELQASGVTFVHCPHNSRKEVADRVLLVDLLVFALESQTPTTIVIITGDKDFNYAVSILQMKGHKVYIIYPPGTRTHKGLKHIADGILDWDYVLDREGLLEFEAYSTSKPMQSVASQGSLDQSRTFVEKSMKLSTAESLSSKKDLPLTPLSVVIAKSKLVTESEDKGQGATLLDLPVDKGLRVQSSLSGSSVRSAHSTKAQGPPRIASAQSSTSQEKEVIVLDSSDDETWAPPGLGVRGISKQKDVPVSRTPCPDSGRSRDKADTLTFKPFEGEPQIKDNRDGKFSDLIAVLLQQKARGQAATAYEDLEVLLRKANPLVCEQAGVPGMRQFIDLAQRSGIVLFSDIIWQNKRGWVRLSTPSTQAEKPKNLGKKALSGRVPGSEAGQRGLRTFTNGSHAPLRLAPRRNIKPGEAHYSRLVEMMQDLRIRGTHRIRDRRLCRLLRDEGLMDQRTYIDKALSLGILYDKAGDGYLELHPDCC